MPRRDIIPANEAGFPLTPDEAQRATFLVMGGRGGTGKTFLLRWICERALNAGRAVVIADGDRTNRSLPLFLDGVLAPPSANDHVVRRWLEAIIEKQAEDRFNVVVDLGGGDLVLKQMAAEMSLREERSLVAFLQRYGITPAILHMLNAEEQSLAYLKTLEDQGLFAPERTALILNEGGVAANPEDEEKVFARIKEQPIFKAAIRRGATPIIMPRLVPATDINARHLSFADAAAGKTKEGLPPLGIFRRERVAIWLRAMETAFAPIAGWLP